jgi:hypothetical protein
MGGKALTRLGRNPRRAQPTFKAGPVYDLDQLIVQTETGHFEAIRSGRALVPALSIHRIIQQ